MSKDSYDEYAQMMVKEQEEYARWLAKQNEIDAADVQHEAGFDLTVHEDRNGDRFIRDYEQGGLTVYLDDNEWKGEYDIND